VSCVSVAIPLTAALSLQSASLERAGGRPVPDRPDPGSRGERLSANTIAIVCGEPDPTCLTIVCDLSANADGGNKTLFL
jgi:hypothetical protein